MSLPAVLNALECIRHQFAPAAGSTHLPRLLDVEPFRATQIQYSYPAFCIHHFINLLRKAGAGALRSETSAKLTFLTNLSNIGRV